MENLMASLGPGELFLIGVGILLALAGFVNTIGSAVEKLSRAWNAMKAPDREQTEKILALEAWKEEHEKDFTEYKGGVDRRFREALDLIEKLQKHHESDMAESREERQLIVYGLLSCLKGLQEQGCDGPVSEAVEKLEKHLNAKAHKR